MCSPVKEPHQRVSLLVANICAYGWVPLPGDSVLQGAEGLKEKLYQEEGKKLCALRDAKPSDTASDAEFGAWARAVEKAENVQNGPFPFREHIVAHVTDNYRDTAMLDALALWSEVDVDSIVETYSMCNYGESSQYDVTFIRRTTGVTVVRKMSAGCSGLNLAGALVRSRGHLAADGLMSAEEFEVLQKQFARMF